MSREVPLGVGYLDERIGAVILGGGFRLFFCPRVSAEAYRGRSLSHRGPARFRKVFESGLLPIW